MNNADTPLTHDEHRELADEMLDGTKSLTTVIFKTIGEGIQNDNKSLNNIKSTLDLLHILGFSYFIGNFADRDRYEGLVCPFRIFVDKVVTHLRSLDLDKTADILFENMT
jgi:hypothetical protein